MQTKIWFTVNCGWDLENLGIIWVLSTHQSKAFKLFKLKFLPILTPLSLAAKYYTSAG